MYHVCLANGRNVFFLPKMAFLRKKIPYQTGRKCFCEHSFMHQLIAAVLCIMIYNKHRMLQWR